MKTVYKKVFSQPKTALCFLLFWCCLQVSAQQPVTDREKNLEGVVLNGAKTKYRNKKENPAYAIMQKVWEKQRRNGLERLDTYRYQEYEKIQFDLTNIDSAFTQRRVFNKLDFIFDYADSTENGKLRLPIFLNEAIYRVTGENRPQRRTKRLLTAQKTSGFQDNQIVTLTAKNLYREVNIYDNTLNYFDIGFQSPAGRNGFGTYEYELRDTVQVADEPCYVIQYSPKNPDALAFAGTLFISAQSYAVVEATLRSTHKMSVNFVNGIYTRLTYQNPDAETYLPASTQTTLELSLLSKKKDAKSLTATRTVTYQHYELNPALTEKDFLNDPRELSPEFSKKEDAYWAGARPDSLTGEEQKIYELVDRLEKTPKYQRITKLYETLSSGYYHIGKSFDFGNIFSIYGYNEVEGHRIRLGGRTYFGQNDPWRIQGYAAYGFRDDKIKYGLEGKALLSQLPRWIAGAGIRRDVMQLGAQLTTDDGIMTRSFASSTVFARGENVSLSRVQQANIFTSVEPWKNVTLRLDATTQTIESADMIRFPMYYTAADGTRQSAVQDTHFTLGLMARPGAKFSQTGVERYEHSTLAPTLLLKYTVGAKDILHSDYDYQKIQLLLYKPFLIGSWGKTFLTVEAGKNFSALPLPLLNVLPANQSYGLVPQTFALLNYYEFVTDQYATAHWEHHFNGKLLNQIPLLRELKLREVVFLRAAAGSLGLESRMRNHTGFPLQAPDKNIYYEYGFGIENIGVGNLRFLRIDFNWRGNYLQSAEAPRFGIKAGLQFYY